MGPPFLLLSALLPAGSVPTGSLVCSLLEPHIDAYKPKLPPPAPLVITPASSVSGFLHNSKSQKFSTALTQLLSVHVQPSSGGATQLATSAIKRYEQTAQREYFALICKEDAAKLWIEEMIKAGEKCYMVGGIMTVLDADVREAKSLKLSTGTDLTVPVSTLLSGGADTLGILNPGVGLEWTTESGKGLSFTAPGEMIWAIQYRRIKFESFKKKVAETAFLDKAIHWQPLSGQRAETTRDKEELVVDIEDLAPSHEEELGAYFEEENFIVPVQMGS